MEDSKHHHCAAYQEQKSKHFCPLHLGIRVTKQVTTQSSTGWNNTLLTQQRDRAISASVVVVGPPWPADLSRCPMHGSLPMHTPLQLQWKEPHPLPNEDRYSNGLSRCRHTRLKETSKTIEPETRNDISTRDDKSPVMGFLSLGKAHSSAAEWGSRKTAQMRLPFPTPTLTVYARFLKTFCLEIILGSIA